MSTQEPRLEAGDAVEKAAPAPAKQPMPTWKKITIAGVSLAVIIGLSVGLGVGLTRHKGGDDNSDADGGSSSSSHHNNTVPDLHNISARPSKWTPKVGDSWQIILHNTVRDDVDFTPDVEAWDFDLFENDRETIDRLHGLGKKVICYFSAGTWEKGREDADEFPEEDLGGTLPEWTDERWARIGSEKVRGIMTRRIQIAASKGCDAIDPDNVDGFVSTPF